MHSSALVPPNRQLLSDGIVRQVIQRSKPQSFDLFAIASSGSSSLHQTNDTRHSPSNEAELARAAAEIDLRRQRNRMHQAKHKMKQQTKTMDLEMRVRQLRDEIQQLRVQREVISAGVSSNTTVWSVAAEYFRLFRNGYQPPIPTLPPKDLVGSLQLRETFPQRDFFLATMAEDVVADGGYGVDTILEDWRQLSLCHDDFQVELVRLDVGEDDTLIARVRSTTTMSEKALRHGFPHLFHNEQWTPIAMKLHRQRIVMEGYVTFIWDAERGQVASLQYTVDMLTPIMQLLGSLEEAAQVFDRAHLTPESRLMGGN